MKARVAHIAELCCDDESAHSAEDALWSDVLAAIAQGADDPAGLAAAAIETIDIEFARWCA